MKSGSALPGMRREKGPLHEGKFIPCRGMCGYRERRELYFRLLVLSYLLLEAILASEWRISGWHILSPSAVFAFYLLGL